MNGLSIEEIHAERVELEDRRNLMTVRHFLIDFEGSEGGKLFLTKLFTCGGVTVI